MTKPRAVKLIFILLAMLMSSCVQVEQATPTPGTPTPPGKALTWEKIIEDPWADSRYMYRERAPDMVIITDKDSITLLQKQLEPSNLDLVEEVDFSAFFVVALY